MEEDFSPVLRVPLEVEDISWTEPKALMRSAQDFYRDILIRRAGTRRGDSPRLDPPAARGEGAGKGL